MLNTINHPEEINFSRETLASLTVNSGGIVSSKTGHYKSIWIRDNLFCSYAYEYMGEKEKAYKTVDNVFNILLSFKDKIKSITQLDDPFTANSYIPSRYSDLDQKELPQEISYLHLDLPGLFLYRIAQIHSYGYKIVSNNARKEFISLLVNYLEKMEWPHTLEYGIWEEGPELHTSTLACVLAGLELMTKYFPEIKIQKKFINHGKKKLFEFLPTESVTRPTDMCLLSVFWPLSLIKIDTAHQLIMTIENELVKKKGLIRYSRDGYYNPRPDSPRGTEPRWPLGFGWLAICFFSLIPLTQYYLQKKKNSAAKNKEPDNEIEYLTPHECYTKGMNYLDKCRQQKDIYNHIPELISGGEPNINSPFAWAESFYIVANSLAMDYKDEFEKPILNDVENNQNA
jgi:GH15 family glucan-1,4-alpha-glucosidase